jgi:hypothetical protein
MREDLSKLIDQVANMKRVSRAEVIERIKEIVSSRADRELELNLPLKVEFNEEIGEAEVYSFKWVVEVVEHEKSQIDLREAIKIKPDTKLGDLVPVRVEPLLVKTLLPGVLRELYTGISDEGRENKAGMGKGRIGDDYRVAETYKTRNLPRIPDLPEPATPVSMPGERFEEVSDVEGTEGDTRDLISVLVNDRSDSEISGNGKKSLSVSNDESELNTERVLSEIEKVLMENGYSQLRRNLNELEVDIIKCDSPFTIIFRIYNEIVSARSLLPFVKGVSIDLLVLCGQADFISNVGIALQKDKPCYVVRSTYPAKALSRSSLWEMVSQTILDASKANEIINSKKPVGK